MKRLTSLFGALILGFTLTTTMFLPSTANAVDVDLMGTPVHLDRPDGFITGVDVEIKKGWFYSEAIALYIEIRSVNNGSWDNGSQLIPLSTGTLFDPFRDTALISVAWDDKQPEPDHVNQTYFVTVQVLVNGKVLTTGYNEFCYGNCSI